MKHLKSSSQGLRFVTRVELALPFRGSAWNNELIMRVIVSLGQISMYSPVLRTVK